MKLSSIKKNLSYFNKAAEVLGIASSVIANPDNAVELLPEGSSEIRLLDRVHFLSVGESDCTLIQSGCHFALIDCGSKLWAQKTIGYIKKLGTDGKTDIDFILLNSLTEDNLDAFKMIIADPDIAVGEVYLNTLYKENLKEEDRCADEIRSKMMESSISKCIKVKSVLPTEEFEFGSLVLKFLNSEPDNYHRNISKEDNSAAVLVKQNKNKILILNSMTDATGDIIRLANRVPKADVITLPQNGKEKLKDEAIALFKPQAVICQNSAEKIDPQIIGEFMLKASANIYLTDDNDGIAVSFTANGLKYNNSIY